MTNGVEYTDIDLNSAGATTVFDADGDATVTGVHMKNGGSTAEVELQATDGTDTATLAEPGAGSSLEFGDSIALDSESDLQIEVTTAEGSAQSNTAVVHVGDE